MTHATLAEDALVNDGYPRRRREIDAVALALDNRIDEIGKLCDGRLVGASFCSRPEPSL